MSVEVKKSQHRYVIGPRGNGIQDILQATGVAVDVPSLETPSETITLRGEQDKLGPALTMVYSKVSIFKSLKKKKIIKWPPPYSLELTENNSVPVFILFSMDTIIRVQ